MAVCSSVAGLAVNKKQPAELRFTKCSTSQNMTPTSPGSANTLFGERLEPTKQEKDTSEQLLSSHAWFAVTHNLDLNTVEQEPQQRVLGTKFKL